MKEKKNINPILICIILIAICFVAIKFVIPGIDHLLFGRHNYEIAIMDGLRNNISANRLNTDSELQYTIIKSYMQYQEILKKTPKRIKNIQNIDILEKEINSEYFNTKNLVLIEYATAGTIDEHISNVEIQKNEAIITFRRSGKSTGPFAEMIKAFFVPIESKNFNSVRIEVTHSFDQERYLNIFLIISPLALLVTLIVEVVKIVKNNKKISEQNTEKIVDAFYGDANIKKNNYEKLKMLLLVIGIILAVFFSMIYINIYNYARNTVAAKPIIYLYPKKEQEILVKLGYKDKITVSYPKYENGWNVIAKPNGDITYLENNRELYSLYYESDVVNNFKVEKDGFIVKKENITEFLEEKLKILGLNDREAEEFIIYWLPKLEENEYNYIRFATQEEINRNMPLEISPKPDNIIRVLMTYKGLEKPITVKEQKIETPNRTGFVAVEWGGTQID